MENTTYFGPNKLFLENKDHENLRACVCIHAYAHPCSSSACTCVCMLRFQKLCKASFFAFTLGLEQISYRLGATPNPYFLTI